MDNNVKAIKACIISLIENENEEAKLVKIARLVQKSTLHNENKTESSK